MFLLNIQAQVTVNNRDDLTRLKRRTAAIRNGIIDAEDNPVLRLFNSTDISKCRKYSGCKKHIGIRGANGSAFPRTVDIFMDLEYYETHGARCECDIVPKLDRIHDTINQHNTNVNDVAKKFLLLTDFETTENIITYKNRFVRLYDSCCRDFTDSDGRIIHEYRESRVGQYH